MIWKEYERVAVNFVPQIMNAFKQFSIWNYFSFWGLFYIALCKDGILTFA